ncbi:MAG TPA: CBS domain-containing protein [Syntrophales bacterium]|jgi:predicted transcriptional regulator|nr:CBS domain-containing protein [Syntrophales bacterium]HPX56776.1 CBS domain-containing protein [Syntrophales bacterium]HQA83458.1 CBS domain-containing protein [Syntrophales bacterium]
MKVRDVFCHDITSLSENMTVRMLIRTMSLTRNHAVPIVSKDNRYYGCIDVYDIIDACLPDYMKGLTSSAILPTKFYDNLRSIQARKISEFVDRNYPFVSPDDSLNYAETIFNKTKRRTLPVVRKDTFLGILTQLELLTVVLKD